MKKRKIRFPMRRIHLLWQEGLLCQRCHGELCNRAEIDAGICRKCAAFVVKIEAKWAKGAL